MRTAAKAGSKKLVVECEARRHPLRRQTPNEVAHPIGRCISKQTAARANPIEGGELNEVEAIRRAQQGDGAAFERLYLLHCRRVHALCLRMLKNPVDAEELVQEVFLQLFRKIATFRGDSALSTWLYRITVNLMLMRLRKRSLQQVSLEAAIEPDQETNGPAKDVGAPDLRLTGAIDRVILERCTEQLPPGYRTVFILHDIQGYEHNEIAEILGCSTGNSKSQLHKARMRLRELLHEYQRGNARDLLEVCKQAEAKGDAVHEI